MSRKISRSQSQNLVLRQLLLGDDSVASMLTTDKKYEYLPSDVIFCLIVWRHLRIVLKISESRSGGTPCTLATFDQLLDVAQLTKPNPVRSWEHRGELYRGSDGGQTGFLSVKTNECEGRAGGSTVLISTFVCPRRGKKIAFRILG